jgi:SAM-dependent methyltransferase
MNLTEVANAMSYAHKDEAHAAMAIRNRHVVAPRRSPIARILCGDFAFLARCLRHIAGRPMLLRTRDRWLLENVFLPYYGQLAANSSVLFVGCDFYTKHYVQWFSRHRYITIDPDASKARFGGGQRHYIATLQDSAKFIPDNTIDLIVLNGVFEFGINSDAEAALALHRCHSLLKPGGLLLIGWSQVPNRTQINVGDQPALRRFTPLPLPLLNVASYVVPTAYQHCYELHGKS